MSLDFSQQYNTHGVIMFPAGIFSFRPGAGFGFHGCFGILP
jgi:hypothetical protein